MDPRAGPPLPARAEGQGPRGGPPVDLFPSRPHGVVASEGMQIPRNAYPAYAQRTPAPTQFTGTPQAVQRNYIPSSPSSWERSPGPPMNSAPGHFLSQKQEGPSPAESTREWVRLEQQTLSPRGRDRHRGRYSSASALGSSCDLHPS